MRFIKQLLIILGVTFAGEALHFLLPLPVPASIYGLVLMLLCLCFKVFPLRAVEETGDFLIDLMPALFIPATVGVMAAWDVLQPVLLQVALITFLSLRLLWRTAEPGHICIGAVVEAKVSCSPVQSPAGFRCADHFGFARPWHGL